MVELVDTLVLGTSAARLGGSSPLPRTNNKRSNHEMVSAFFVIRTVRTRTDMRFDEAEAVERLKNPLPLF